MISQDIHPVRASHRTSFPLGPLELTLDQTATTSRQTAISCENFLDGYIPSQPTNASSYGWQTVPIAYPGLEYSQSRERQILTPAESEASPLTLSFHPGAGPGCVLTTGMVATGLIRLRTQPSPSMVSGNGAWDNPITLTKFE